MRERERKKELTGGKQYRNVFSIRYASGLRCWKCAFCPGKYILFFFYYVFIYLQRACYSHVEDTETTYLHYYLYIYIYIYYVDKIFLRFFYSSSPPFVVVCVYQEVFGINRVLCATANVQLSVCVYTQHLQIIPVRYVRHIRRPSRGFKDYCVRVLFV